MGGYDFNSLLDCIRSYSEEQRELINIGLGDACEQMIVENCPKAKGLPSWLTTWWNSS